MTSCGQARSQRRAAPPARPWLLLVLACAAALCASGCHHAKHMVAIYAKNQGKQYAVHAAAALPEQLVKANFDLTVITDKLIAEVKSVGKLPEPGEIRLSDFDVALKDLEGQAEVDFLTARPGDTKAERFRYARFDEPVLDAFLKETMLAKALSYQTLQTMKQLVAECSAVLGASVQPGPSFHVVVEGVLERPNVVADVRTRIGKLHRIAKVLGVLVPSFAKRAHELVKAGQELATNLNKVVTNGRVLLNVSTLAQSLTVSGEALLQTGLWSAEIAGTMRGFTGDHKRRDPFDVEEARLTREELQARLFDAP